MRRCFNENPTTIEGRPMYGSTDPFTLDLADLMFEFYKNGDRKRWIEMFERFKSYWNLEIMNPYVSQDKMLWFARKMEELETTQRDEVNKEDLTYEWNLLCSEII